MKLGKKTDVQEFKNGDNLIAWEYPLADVDINIAVVRVSGRYPEQGQAVNERSKEIGYIKEGSITLTVNGVATELGEGDAVLIEPGERFFWEGNATMVMPCAPAWTPEQHKVIE